MSKDNSKQRMFSRRAVIFGGLQMMAFTALAGRLYYLQFIKAEEYKTLSENNRIKLQLMAPARGLLLDRYGIAMASNQQNYQIFMDYSSLNQTTYHHTIDLLHSLLPFSEKRYAQLKKNRVSRASMPELLREHLNWEEVALIELHAMSLPGVFIEVGQIRHYPFADKAAHLIGYVGTVSKNEVEAAREESLLRLPDFKIGKNGIEQMLEDELRGTAGIRQLEVNVHGVPVREVGRKESIPGRDVTLTIDARLQDFTAERVKDEGAAVIVMEIDTGNILAMVSMPGFDPEVFSKGISNDLWKQLNSNKKGPLLNKAISGQYPPGSTFKMMVGLAGLRAGVINPATTVYCPGHFYLGNHRFNCWKEEGHGTVNYHQAVEQSCDTFFYTVAQRLGVDDYHHMVHVCHTCGLGEDHPLGIIGQKKGIIPDPEWKMRVRKQRWTGGDTINASIGQGFVLTTPLQLLVMVARLASGYNVSPRLLDTGPPTLKPIDIKEEFLDITRDAMAAVVNSPMGTAYGKKIKEEAYAFGGKTGTSQVRRITQRGVDQSTLPWEHRHHALFVGYAPIDKPKYAACVVIEHGGGGSSAAAPVARDVLLKIQQLEEEDARRQ